MERFRFIEFANDELGVLVKPNPEGIMEQWRYDTSTMPEAREKLKSLLIQLINDGEVRESEDLDYFIKIKAERKYHLGVEKGRVVNKSMIDMGSVLKIMATPYWFIDIVDELVAYLSDPKTDFKKLKMCDRCNKFKIGKRVPVMGQNKFCSDECKDLFHREKRKEEKYHTKYMREYPR